MPTTLHSSLPALGWLLRPGIPAPGPAALSFSVSGFHRLTGTASVLHGSARRSEAPSWWVPGVLERAHHNPCHVDGSLLGSL